MKHQLFFPLFSYLIAPDESSLVPFKTKCHLFNWEKCILKAYPLAWVREVWQERERCIMVLFVLINYFNWRVITLQYCSGFCHTLTWISHVYMCPPSWAPSYLPPYPIPQGHSNALALSAVSHASNLDWWSISHMIIYMFQYYSLKSSHPRLLPQSPKVCSLHLCLFRCLAYRVIITPFLNSKYMY